MQAKAPSSDRLVTLSAPSDIGRLRAPLLEKLARFDPNRGEIVIGLDNLNSYYSVQLKRDRLAQLQGQPNFRFETLDLADRAGMARLFESNQFDIVIHLAAQAGVRYSLTKPGGD